VAVLSWVDSETVTLLAKVAPDMFMHTETDPSASLAVKEGAENPTFTGVESMIVTLENGCAITTAESADPSITANNSAASTTLSLEMETEMHI